MSDLDLVAMAADAKASPAVTLGMLGGLWFSRPNTVKFKFWNGETEESLSRAVFEGRGAMEGGRIARKITITLAHMCTEIAGVQLWSEKGDSYEECMSRIDRENFIRNLWETDVLTAYLLLRYEALGDTYIKLNVPSPHDPDGKRMVPWKGDLNAFEFKGASTIEDARWTYELRRPYKIRGKEVHRFVMGPLRWATADSLQFQTKGYEAKMRSILGSIHLIPEVSEAPNFPFADIDLHRMHKVDIEGLVQGIESHVAGLDLEIEAFDQEAKRSFTTTLPWLHEDFFASSSLSRE